jgi:NAD(P)-dependent dehydrogenase (short-subunit alcohol dehydrogenase family)
MRRLAARTLTILASTSPVSRPLSRPSPGAFTHPGWTPWAATHGGGQAAAGASSSRDRTPWFRRRYISAYAAGKHGVLGLVRSAAAELAGTGVTVNAVCPGYVDTPMTDRSVANIAARTGRGEDDARRILAEAQPIGRLIDPAEVADVVDLCVRTAGITGQGINVDGGAVQS